jgi:hypothetical protein
MQRIVLDMRHKAHNCFDVLHCLVEQGLRDRSASGVGPVLDCREATR